MQGSCVLMIVEGDGDGDVFLTPTKLKSLIKIIDHRGASPREGGREGLIILILLLTNTHQSFY